MASHVPAEIVLATETGHVATVQRWLANGGDPNGPIEVDQERWIRPILDRLLLVAAQNKHPAIIHALLARGADVNSGRVNAFWLAHKGYDVVSARLLVKNGADVSSGIKAAVLDPRVLRFFLISGVDVSAPSCRGETPEHYARSQLQYFTQNLRTFGSDMCKTYTQSVAMLEGARLAGS